jgi:uncharacterized protein
VYGLVTRLCTSGASRGRSLSAMALVISSCIRNASVSRRLYCSPQSCEPVPVSTSCCRKGFVRGCLGLIQGRAGRRTAARNAPPAECPVAMPRHPQMGFTPREWVCSTIALSSLGRVGLRGQTLLDSKSTVAQLTPVPPTPVQQLLMASSREIDVADQPSLKRFPWCRHSAPTDVCSAGVIPGPLASLHLLPYDQAMTREEALRRLAEHRSELERLGVRSLDLFGSLARGDARPDSDVDLLVEFRQPVGLFHFFRVQRELEAILGRRVDLVMKDAIKRQLRTRILAEAVSAT